MKNIFFAIVIVLAAIGACNPQHKSTEGTSTDSTATNNNNNNNNNRTDTSMSTHRDSSMHK